MHKTLLKHKDDMIEFLNKEIAEAIEGKDLDDLCDALCCMKYIAKIVHMDHDMRMDHHEMAMKNGTTVHHTGNPTSAVSQPVVPMSTMSTIDGTHTHSIASFTLGTM